MDDEAHNIHLISVWPPENEDMSQENEDKKQTLCNFESQDMKNDMDSSVMSSLPLISATRKRENNHLNYKLMTGTNMKRLRRTESMAGPALVRWWKKEGHVLCNQIALPQSSNPNTLLKQIGRLPEAKLFMKNEVKRLHAVCNRNETPDIHAALGSYYDKLSHLEEAEWHFSKALQIDPNNNECKWQLHRVQKQINIHRIQESSLKRLTKNDLTQSFPQSVKVDRQPAERLSFSEFFFQYAMTSRPVIITGLGDTITSEPWTLQHIKEVAGECTTMLKKLVSESAEWARLEDYREVKVKDYIDDLASGKGDDLYLFDWSLPLYCPQLATEVTVPKYFAGDFLQRSSPGSLYCDSWPSLFVAPGGLRSELHVDAFGSNFWMALLKGRKRWVFFDKGDTPFLYPSYDTSMDPVFDVDLGHPDLKKHPLLQLTQPKECILEEGELLFVPAGCPHRVENLETSIAISSNYVDLSNLDLVKQELSVNALIDIRAKDLLDQFSHNTFPVRMNGSVQHLPYKLFKMPLFNYKSYNY